jgi:L-erythro-3,5-diaminohexanoate dehydrogenase
MEPIAYLNQRVSCPSRRKKIDNTMEIYDNEVLIDVQTLNVDSASFTQIKEQAGGDLEKLKRL